MDIRVRRSDELFLIHREPTEEEKRLAKKKENIENDPIQAEEERRMEARTRMKKGRRLTRHLLGAKGTKNSIKKWEKILEVS